MTFSHSQSFYVEIYDCFCTWRGLLCSFQLFFQPLYCVSVPNFCSVWSIKGTQHWLSSLLLVLPLARLKPLLKPVWGQTAEIPGILWTLALPVGSPWLPSLLPHKMYLELSVFSLTRKKIKFPFLLGPMVSCLEDSPYVRAQVATALMCGFDCYSRLLFSQYIWIALEGGAMNLLNGTIDKQPVTTAKNPT